MTFKDAEKVLLVDFALQEVGPRGSLEQYKAVCICMRNRMRAGWCDGNWLKLLEEAQEMSPHDAGGRVPWRDDNRALQRMLREVDELVYGQMSDYEGGDQTIYSALEGGERLGKMKTAPALYWTFLERPMRPWFETNIAKDKENHPVRSTMGTMMFFE